MLPGHLVAQRYRVVRLATSGGMGSLFEAVDETSGERVALKIGRLDEPNARRRFEREASVLSQLSHPHVVRYVGHGAVEDDTTYLAMEWLEGLDLAQRLARGALDESSVRAIAVGALEALAYAHSRGVVHRDVKPANLFLVAGDPARTKLVDFGIAQDRARTAMTAHGTVLGTPGYMAPEQARGVRALDPRADLFALGCVLFECLAGHPAFVARDALALLFKILVEEPPSLLEVRPDVSPRMASLVTSMLAKEPEHRPASAKAVLASLVASELAPGTASPSAGAITVAEQQLVCAILGAGLETSTREDAPTLDAEHLATGRARADAAVRSFGAHAEWLADGGLIVVLRGGDGASAQVTVAASCALALSEALDGRPLALATGHAELRASVPVGPVVDRAVEMLRSVRAERGAVLVDPTTERLVEQRFELREGRLLRRRAEPLLTRTLLGRPTRCVGRDRELARLDDGAARCVEERLLDIGLLTGPPGIGKTRLLDEHLERLKRDHPRAVVWRAAGDPLRSGAPLLSIAQLLRSAARAPEETTNREVLDRLQAMVRGRFDERRTADVEHLFRELVAIDQVDGAPRTTDRSDPAIAAERLRRGLGAFFEAALDAGPEPLVLVLEDLHWCDSASLRLLDALLAQRERGAPIRVIAVARPEVRERFPWLFLRREVDEIRVGSLRSAAAKQLVRHTLGAQADDETCHRLVERAAGNPFYLEELVRAVADGRGESLPETVIALSLARLEALDPGDRRVLRAASLLGESFTEDAVAALVPASEEVAPSLRRLCEDEVLVRDDGYGGPRPLHRFRHAYLREAAYSTLTAADRVLGHRLTAELLERRGGEEPSVLAEHYERAGDPRAAKHYLSAARKALRASDLEGAIALAERGTKACADERSALAQDLLRLQAGAQSWRGDFRAVEELSTRMMHAARPGSKAWYGAVAPAIHSAIFLARRRRTRASLALLRDTRPEPDALLAYGRALGATLPVAYTASAHASCEMLHQRFELGAAPLADRDPLVRAMLVWLASYRSFYRDDDPWEALRAVREAGRLFEDAGDTQRALHCEGEVSVYLGDVGDIEGNLAETRRVIRSTAHMGLGPTIALGMLAWNLIERDRLDEVDEFLPWALERTTSRGFSVGEGTARSALAALELRAGRLEVAEREALRATRMTCTAPRYAMRAFAVLARARMARGDWERALRASRAGLSVAERHRPVGPTEVALLLAHAEALAGAARQDLANEVILEARARLLERAARAPDEAARRRYLEDDPACAETLALAMRWTGVAPSAPATS